MSLKMVWQFKWKRLECKEQISSPAVRHMYIIISYQAGNKRKSHPCSWGQTSIPARIAKCSIMECKHSQRNGIYWVFTLYKQISKCTGTCALSKHFWILAGLRKGCIYCKIISETDIHQVLTYSHIRAAPL